MSRLANMTLFEAGLDYIPVLNQADADTDVDGDWIKLRDYEKAYFTIEKMGSEDVDTLGFQLVQATAAAGTSAKAISAPFRYWYKQGTLTSQTVWVPGQLATADDILGIGSSAPSGGTLVVATDVNTDPIILVIEVLAEYLDAANQFDWATVRIEGDEVNNACLITSRAILFGNHYPQAVPLSAIS